MDDQQNSPDLAMFLASAAHDMKNSVAMMSGSLENLLADPSVKASPAYQQMAHMLYETRRMNNNLIQLLALYKEVGSPAYPFDPQFHAISDLVTEIANRNQVLLEAKGIGFESVQEEDKVWCFDEDLVVGVVSHAINNAIHYTKNRIVLKIVDAGDFLQIRVEDNGAGFPAAMLDAANIGRAGVNFMTSSTGLGLYFSAEVAKMHKHRGRLGSIRLENGGESGGGCFILQLP